jgi:hypothetical protein
MNASRFLAASVILATLSACRHASDGPPRDDAGGRKPEDFPELAADVFQPMDGGIQLNPDEIKGRNTWNLWCGGTEQFWDRMSRESYGLIDLLKTIDSRQRGTRFQKLGLINQPGFRQAAKPDAYGLWIDEAVEGQGEPAAIDPKVYGRPTGIGVPPISRIDFGDAVWWDPKRCRSDPDYAVCAHPALSWASLGSCPSLHPCRPGHLREPEMGKPVFGQPVTTSARGRV